MDSDKAIVILTKRKLELEADQANLTIEYEDAIKARDALKGYLKDIGEALDYDGHPGNIAGIIKSQ